MSTNILILRYVLILFYCYSILTFFPFLQRTLYYVRTARCVRNPREYCLFHLHSRRKYFAQDNLYTCQVTDNQMVHMNVVYF